jgi:hypothetical protein
MHLTLKSGRSTDEHFSELSRIELTDVVEDQPAASGYDSENLPQLLLHLLYCTTQISSTHLPTHLPTLHEPYDPPLSMVHSTQQVLTPTQSYENRHHKRQF